MYLLQWRYLRTGPGIWEDAVHRTLTNFLRYRPVLANDRLKTRFGYVPRFSSREAFDNFAALNLRREI